MAAMAIETNPVLKRAAQLVDDHSVVLYLLQNQDGKWKVRWTKHTQMTKKKISDKNVRIETFKILEILPESKAEARRRELWKEYGCSGIIGTPVGVARTTTAGKN